MIILKFAIGLILLFNINFDTTYKMLPGEGFQVAGGVVPFNISQYYDDLANHDADWNRFSALESIAGKLMDTPILRSMGRPPDSDCPTGPNHCWAQHLYSDFLTASLPDSAINSGNNFFTVYQVPFYYLAIHAGKSWVFQDPYECRTYGFYQRKWIVCSRSVDEGRSLLIGTGRKTMETDFVQGMPSSVAPKATAHIHGFH